LDLRVIRPGGLGTHTFKDEVNEALIAANVKHVDGVFGNDVLQGPAREHRCAAEPGVGEGCRVFSTCHSQYRPQPGEGTGSGTALSMGGCELRFCMI